MFKSYSSANPKSNFNQLMLKKSLSIHLVLVLKHPNSYHLLQNMNILEKIFILNPNLSVIHQCHELDNSRLLTCSLELPCSHLSSENIEYSRILSWTIMTLHSYCICVQVNLRVMSGPL